MEDFIAVLERICTKDINCLTPSDIEFLKARSSYLTPEQMDKYLGSKKELTYQELKQLAKERGIKYVGVKADELKRLLNIN
jgi:hypothetical protein